MKNAKRRMDLSSKFVQMGKSLIEEGRTDDDIIISLLGTMVVFIGGVSLVDEDVSKFADLVSMFSAKKMVEAMEREDDERFVKISEKANSQNYDDFVSRLNDLMDLENDSDTDFDGDGDDD
jgi:hypothetical protein